MPLESWDRGAGYERYVGRWSRLVAGEFLRWLDVPPGRRWLDVGCGTGSLSEVILAAAAPDEIVGVDRSEPYVEYARRRLSSPKARFEAADALALPFEAARFDVAVSGLVLNFVPSPGQALAEMVRAVRPEGTVAVYVWDYAGEMQLMRAFWDAAIALDPAARPLDEGVRFPLCAPEPLGELFHEAGLASVQASPIDVPTHFPDFADFWSPFLTAQGPAPSYAMSLPEDARARLRDRIQRTLPVNPDGSIDLVARAWAVRGVKAG